jgi:hypothetical protein
VIGTLFPDWHVAIEPAQVMAGLVEYPSGNPFALYEARLWTGWHQVLTPILAAGVPERALTLALSGVVGAISFAALTAFARGFGADAELAIATPFVLGMLNPTQWDFRYPIILLGHGHTYGMAGLAWLVLVCGVLATERWAMAAFLIGMAPAVHASLGAWLGLLALLCGIARWSDVRPHLAAILRGGILGVAITALSLATQLLTQDRGPAVDPAVASRYLDGFVRFWDAHRVAGNVSGFGAFIVCAGLVVAVSLLRCARPRIGAGAALALRIYIACGALGVVSMLVQRLVPPESIPNTLLIAMPTRLVNLPALAFVPLLMGALGRYRGDVLARVVLVALPALAAVRSAFPQFAEVALPLLGVATAGVIARHAERAGTIRILAIGMLAFVGLRAVEPTVPLSSGDAASISAILVFAVLLAGAWMNRVREQGGVGRAGRLARAAAAGRGARALRALGRRFEERPALLKLPMYLAFAALILLTADLAIGGFAGRWSRLRDRTNDRVLAAASRGQGLLIVAPGISTPQLITRRPVLLDPNALDILPYALAGGPEMEAVLLGVYGIDFFDPPREALHTATIPKEPVRALWQRRSNAEWMAISTRFGVGDVLAPATWKLGLPEEARDKRFALYRIPVPAAGSGPSGSQ